MKRARRELAAAYRLADRLGLNEGISNHFTLRLPGYSDRFLVIPHGLHWSEVTASRLLVVDQDGRVLDGEGEIEPSALFIHSRILRAGEDAACVLNTQQTYATTIAVMDSGRLLPVSQNSLRFHGRVAYDEVYGGAADHAEEGERLATALGDKDVLFHAHHGVIVAGQSMARGFDDLYFLERACQVPVLVQSTGQKLNFVPVNIAEAYASDERPNNLKKQAEEHFAALMRILDREEPDYAD